MSIPGTPSAGRFQSLHFAHLLARCWAGGFSGSFRAQGQSGPALTASKEILFERGRIAWAASDDARESIRTYLLNRGILRPEQWRLAQEKAGSATPRQTLLDLGFLSARELQDADRERISGIVLSLFSWAEGEYATAAGPLPPGTPNLKIDPRDLVLEGIMSSGDRERVLQELGTLDSVLVVRPDDLVRASLSLPVELVELMGRADGTRTVADICALSSLSDFMISAAFAALKVLGLATPAEGSAAAPPAPPKSAGTAAAQRRPPRQVTMPAVDDSAPRLPLGLESSPVESATTQMISTPPEGTAMENPPDAPEALAEDEDDSGTVPMEATPPGGTPSGAAVSGLDGGEDPRTQPMTATPPGGRPAVSHRTDPRMESMDGDESPMDAEDREGETELSPGIPLPPEPMEGSEAPLADEEIESAVRMFDGPQVEDRSAAVEGDPAGEANQGENSSSRPSLEEEPPAPPREPGAGADPAPEADPDMEEAADWVYEPSGLPPAAPRSRRWAAWGGIAAGIFAVGTVLTMILGGGGDATPPDPAPPPGSSRASGPPPVDIPAAPARSGDASGAPGGRAATAQEPAPAPAERLPARVASTEPGSPPPLASTGGGSILDSASFRDARAHLEAGRLDQAARGFQASVRGRSGLYTIQLALACRPETVTRAQRSLGGAQEFFILPKEFNGRACYRILWGAYPGRKAAEHGRSSVPRAFRQAEDRPFVAPI